MLMLRLEAGYTLFSVWLSVAAAAVAVACRRIYVAAADF